MRLIPQVIEPRLDRRLLLAALRAFRRGDFEASLPAGLPGQEGEIAETFNDLVEQARNLRDEIGELRKAIGTEGRTARRLREAGARGGWAESASSINDLLDDLTGHTAEVGRVLHAIASGDFAQSVELERGGEPLRGDFLRYARAANDASGRLSELRSEWLRVVRELCEGRVPTRVRIASAPGAFRELIEAVNRVATAPDATPKRAHPSEPIVPVSEPVPDPPFAGAPFSELLARVEAQERALHGLDRVLPLLGQALSALGRSPEPESAATKPPAPAPAAAANDEERQRIEHERRKLEQEAARLHEQQRELELARKHAEQLALASKHKSQFLAHMSHELRTPLNTLLMLSRQLAQRREGDQGSSQLRYAETIEQAGGDLLDLIDEFLDLAKIESGTMTVDVAPVVLSRLKAYLEQSFRPLAEEKELAFEAVLDPALPARIETDERRLRQILRNLLSNAFKFTEQGSVRLSIERVGDTIEFAVSDTGIGIPLSEQALIFEAFRRAGAAHSGNYAGTGLGLAISRDIARLLGAELGVDSAPGRGSTFSLRLPLQALRDERSRHRVNGAAEPSQVNGTRPTTNGAAERTLLVVEADLDRARALIDAGREYGFRGQHADSGGRAVALVRAQPPDAILLGLELPDADGRVILDRWKRDASTLHVPIYTVSTKKRERESLARGALGLLSNPPSRAALRDALRDLREHTEARAKRLLVVAGDPRERRELCDLLTFDGAGTESADTLEQAIAWLAQQPCDCVVLDLGSLALDRLGALAHLAPGDRVRRLPILAYARERVGQPLPRLDGLLPDVFALRSVGGSARLLFEAVRVLHLPEASLQEHKRLLLRSLPLTDPELENRKVLIVDDEVRSIFALTAMLEPHKLRVTYAASGARALAKLEAESDIELVLMDVKMPDLDGYEVTRRIHEQARPHRPRVIALTAGATPGERDRCLAAGADDYLAKPVEPEQLLSLLRVWLNDPD